ncbi:hypothetical protein EMPS_06490 [Entomortierella parvispora]|uniref:Uncharacterized protein n=1 Tax=Entomortierella parvispora TaxID=205924 RepID=A0A9P3HD25_9FUNG|nr:hypothetical protein EMPS_06490 [Entomortierella parvispora]
MPGSGDRKQSTGASGPRRKASQSNASNSGTPELGKSSSSSGYVPVNNFNSQDVVNHFDRTWKAAKESFHQAGAGNSAKTEMYKGTEAMAWGVAPKGTLSTGADFLSELKRKQPAAP